MFLDNYLRLALNIGPYTLIRKIVKGIQRRSVRQFARAYDRKRITYSNRIISDLGSYFDPISLELLQADAGQLAAVTNHYLDHRFDLLGSGWVQVKHGMCCRGLEKYCYAVDSPVQIDSAGYWLKGRINSANLAESQRIWRLLDAGYKPIDWHLDFKSGYRWSEAVWYLDIRHGHKPGVDIKVPWELSRMQHLSQLVWAYALARSGTVGFKLPQAYVREFRNQILDFIATNPPRFGVNWRMPMDIAIRAANWLVAYDLFKAYGAEFDAEFEIIFKRSVYEHGVHVVNNLEWNNQLRGNHYLSDIVGLLFIAAYLPRMPETDAWLALATQELVNEVQIQFFPDGANFEASTSYHRLSTEMVVYATALLSDLPSFKQEALQVYDHRLYSTDRPALKPAPLLRDQLPDGDGSSLFPTWYIERLEKMAEFTYHITKPDNHIPQIGDNDNGRFFKFQPVYHRLTVAEAKAAYANLKNYSELIDSAIYWDEDHLDHRHLVAAINGLFERNDFTKFSREFQFEKSIVQSLAGGVIMPGYSQLGEQLAAEQIHIGEEESKVKLGQELETLSGIHLVKIPVSGSSLLDDLQHCAYPDFGAFLYRSRRLYLIIHCGPIGQKGNGGHAHNDQLSIELMIDGKDWIRDPGTYLYTPLPNKRNQYRSVMAHFTPQIENEEPGKLNAGLFRLGSDAKAICHFFDKRMFIGSHTGYTQKVFRIIEIKDNVITIKDFTTGPKKLKTLQVALEKAECNVIPYSSGYGIQNA